MRGRRARRPRRRILSPLLHPIVAANALVVAPPPLFIRRRRRRRRRRRFTPPPFLVLRIGQLHRASVRLLRSRHALALFQCAQPRPRRRLFQTQTFHQVFPRVLLRAPGRPPVPVLVRRAVA